MGADKTEKYGHKEAQERFEAALRDGMNTSRKQLKEKPKAKKSKVKRLASSDPEAARLREAVSRTIAGELRIKGGILAVLRRSPLVGANLDLTRSCKTRSA